MAFEQEGFYVVRGPDALLGGDIRDWHPLAGRFDGLIGGPPCQPFSRAVSARGGPDAASEGDLIPEFERAVREARPCWCVMENVPAAPVPQGAAWSEILDAHAFEAAQRRRRRFFSNLPLQPEPVPADQRHPDSWPTVTV